MARTFREWDVDQSVLFPPNVMDRVPEGHVAGFVKNRVVEELDFDEILKSDQEERGYPTDHPVMMTLLILYGYCRGIDSSRRIARACVERVDFMVIVGMDAPDFRTVNKFRKRHLDALRGMLGQVPGLCRQAGLARMGHVALDGRKMRANASRHKAMSYGRMKKAETEIARQVFWIFPLCRASSRIRRFRRISRCSTSIRMFLYSSMRSDYSVGDQVRRASLEGGKLLDSKVETPVE